MSSVVIVGDPMRCGVCDQCTTAGAMGLLWIDEEFLEQSATRSSGVNTLIDFF